MLVLFSFFFSFPARLAFASTFIGSYGMGMSSKMVCVCVCVYLPPAVTVCQNVTLTPQELLH